MIETLTQPTIEATPAAEYFADHSRVSQSMLNDFADRRRKYDAYYVSRLLGKPPSTDPMRKGTALHTALLEPDRFDSLVVSWPTGLLSAGDSIRTNEAKAFRDEHAAAGRIVLKDSERASVLAMRASVRHTCGKWLDMPSRKEHSIYWTDEETGLALKMRLDILLVGQRPVIFDLKKTSDASPAGFRKSCEQYGYGIQDAQYRDGCEQVMGETPLFYFIAVEDTFPFACAIHELDDESAANAAMYRRRLLGELRQCLDSGDWSEPFEGRINKLSLRPWCFEGNQ